VSLLRTFIWLDIIRDSMPDVLRGGPQIDKRFSVTNLPKTVDAAVDRLISEMALKDKVFLAYMHEDDLASLYPSLGEYIRDKFGLRSGNKALMESCKTLAGKKELQEYAASEIIIKKLWKELRESHVMRAVK
jgi:hypothetical protein